MERKHIRHLLSNILLIILISNSSELLAQQRKQIFIEKANIMRNLKKDGVEIRRLLGDVKIRHEDITMLCDSAYEYVGSNRFDAFGNVVVIQEDSKMYGDTMRYDGNSKTGRVRGQIVKLVDKDAVLKTRYLDFNTQNNTAFFYNGGIINFENASLSCERGTYYIRTKQFVFGGSVAYLNPDILLNTDSLEYHYNQEMIYFYGPTSIFNDDNFIFCERGWHNRNSEESEFLVNAYIDNGKQQLFGDRIFSNNQSGFSQIVGNGCIVDTSRNLFIFGGTINYYQNQDFAEVNHSPFAFSVSSEGDTLFLRANVLIGETHMDSLESMQKYQLLKGIGNVRFYRHDIQGICDTMVYHSTDSTLHMYSYPVLWNEDNQLSANYINLLFKNELIHRMNFFGSSFICSQEDSLKFNQIKGREMVGFFNRGRLSRLDVVGNAETVYFARDKGVITAINRAESSRLSIALKENRVVSIMFKEKPSATLFPIDKASPEDVMIKGFNWQIDDRPAKHSVVPSGLNIKFYLPIQGKANIFRDKRKNPAESL